MSVDPLSCASASSGQPGRLAYTWHRQTTCNNTSFRKLLPAVVIQVVVDIIVDVAGGVAAAVAVELIRGWQYLYVRGRGWQEL